MSRVAGQLLRPPPSQEPVQQEADLRGSGDQTQASGALTAMHTYVHPFPYPFCAVIENVTVPLETHSNRNILLYIQWCVLCNLYCILSNPYCVLCDVYCVLCNLYYFTVEFNIVWWSSSPSLTLFRPRTAVSTQVCPEQGRVHEVS